MGIDIKFKNELENIFINTIWEVIYVENKLPPFRMGKCRRNNRIEKQKIDSLNNDYLTKSRDYKLNNILENTNLTIESNEKFLQNNETKTFRSNGRFNKKVNYYSCYSTENLCNYIQNEFRKYDICVPLGKNINNEYFIHATPEEVGRFINNRNKI